MSGGELAFFGGVIGAGFAIGFAARRWWSLGILAVPSLFVLAVALPEWGEQDSDGVTTGDWVLVGLILVGLPLLVGGAAGVIVGRLVFPPPGER